MGVRDQVIEAYSSEEVETRVFTAGGGAESFPSGAVGFTLDGLTDWLFTAKPDSSITDYQWELYVYDGHNWHLFDDSATNVDFSPTESFGQNYYVAGWQRGIVRVLNSTGDDTRFTSLATP